MTIQYRNGYTVQAFLLSRTENSMRVAIDSAEDATVLTQVNGTWITEDCEPVTVAAAWSDLDAPPIVKIDDCICPPELATRLLMMFLSGESDPEVESAIANRPLAAPAATQLV